MNEPTHMQRFFEDFRNYGAQSRRFFAGVGHTVAGGIGGLIDSTPAKIGLKGTAGHLSYYSMNNLRHAASSGLGFTGRALVSGMGAVAGGVKGIAAFRRDSAADMNWRRFYADQLSDMTRPLPSEHGPWGGASRDPYKHQAKYGKQKDGFRRFGVRTAGEHMSKGVVNMAKAMTSPLGIGINLGLATWMSDNNIFDPYNGMVKNLAENVGAEVGFIGGGALGAAAASFLVPGGPILGAIAAGIGFLGGGIMGADAGASAANLPWAFSKFGSKYGRRSVARKSKFIDSEGAATMRQRAMQAISRSQMNARSAFGQESLAYHG